MELKLEKLKIDFHGGEPMLQKVDAFDEMCTLLHRKLSKYVDLHFSIQTNGTLVTEEWIDVCAKHRVGIGISCDGPAEYHDEFRVDHKGGGSYESLEKNLIKLQSAEQQGLINPVGILCVIDPKRDARKIFDHFFHHMGVKRFNFLLPDFTQDSFSGSAESYGKFLCDLFNSWVEVDDPTIDVRILKQTLEKFTMDALELKESNCAVSSYREITIASNGNLAPIDTLRSASENYMWSEANVQNTSMSNYLHHPFYRILGKAGQTLPEKCANCRWQNICQGGGLINRYSSKRAFDNPSVFCLGLKQFYQRCTEYLLSQNYPKENLEALLY
jgi:uncharacterized protein